MYKLVNFSTGEEAEIFTLVSTVLKIYGLETNARTTDADLENIEQSYIENGGMFKVLKDEKKIIGSYGLFRVNEQTCELRKMYLYPKYRGKGLGKRMLEDALCEAKSCGFKTMILETNKVLVEAKGLYQKYGFKEFTPVHLSDRCDSAMKKEL